MPTWLYLRLLGGHGIPKDKNILATEEYIDNCTYLPDRAHTMIGRKKINNIQMCFEECIKNNIEGDMIETGVWKGGATIFMQGLVKYCPVVVLNLDNLFFCYF